MECKRSFASFAHMPLGAACPDCGHNPVTHLNEQDVTSKAGRVVHVEAGCSQCQMMKIEATLIEVVDLMAAKRRS